MTARASFATMIALLALGASASDAAAAFDQIKVREVLPGISEYSTDPEFVELQTFADDQATVGGQVIGFYGPDGSVKGSYTLPGDVADGTSQRSILIATSNLSGVYNVTPDFEYPAAMLETDGGAVCYSNLDCVAWGSFPGTNSAPIIPQGNSLVRSIAPGCATLLEGSDDSDNSGADFSLLASPTPRNNAAVPSERPCGGPGAAPETVITKAPRKKTRRRTATFGFTSDLEGASFECKLDNRRFNPCDSPISYGKDGKRLKRGRHSFQVMAVVDGVPDPTAARYAWRVTKKKRKANR